MNGFALPVDRPELLALVDARIAEAGKAAAGKLPITRSQWLVIIVLSGWILLSSVLFVVGYDAYTSEVNARLDGNCQTILKVRTALRSVLLTATAPRDRTTALHDPDRLAAVDTLNAQLAEARKKYLPPINKLACD